MKIGRNENGLFFKADIAPTYTKVTLEKIAVAMAEVTILDLFATYVKELLQKAKNDSEFTLTDYQEQGPTKTIELKIGQEFEMVEIAEPELWGKTEISKACSLIKSAVLKLISTWDIEI